MEKENNLSERILKLRPALTDTTNLPSKRPFSLISGDDVVDNFVKKKCHTHNNNDVLLQSKGKNPCFESPIRIDNSPDDVNSQEPNTRSGKSEERNETSGGSLEKPPNDEGFVDRANEVDDKEVCVVEDLGPHKFGCVTVEPPTIPASSGSKFLGLERCLGLKSQDYAKSPAELLKECTCSFCTKGSYDYFYACFSLLKNYFIKAYLYYCGDIVVNYVDHQLVIFGRISITKMSRVD